MPEGPAAPEKIKLVAQFKTQNELMSLKYNSETQVLGFLDTECTIGSTKLSSALLSGKAESSEVEEDIDMDEIDAMMEDEEGEKRADDALEPIDLDEMKDAMSDAVVDKPKEAQEEVVAVKVST